MVTGSFGHVIKTMVSLQKYTLYTYAHNFNIDTSSTVIFRGFTVAVQFICEGDQSCRRRTVSELSSGEHVTCPVYLPSLSSGRAFPNPVIIP